jgi:L,D-transpeptidase ErfK/SrfK
MLNRNKINLHTLLIGILLFGISLSASALIFHMPENDDSVIGGMRITQIKKGNTFYKLSRKYEMGYDEMVAANPNIAKYSNLSLNKPITIPSFFILPNTPHQGLIVNLPEFRLYYYPTEYNVVITEPVSVGRPNWSTPLLITQIIEKTKNPPWVVPESILINNAKRGVYLPSIVPPGPRNPLGKFALRLSKWSILIHGTNQPHLIGKRVSSGCIRMYPEDIEFLFSTIAKGTAVHIIDQPYKVGWQKNKLYLEAHMPFLETRNSPMEELEKVRQLVLSATQNQSVNIDWHAVVTTLAKHSGIPHVIGVRL